jgi:hypothetical protein
MSYKFFIIIILIFESCEIANKEIKEDIITIRFRPSFKPYSIFEIRSDNINTWINSKIYSEKNPATNSGLDSVYHKKSMKIERKRIEPIIQLLSNLDSKSYKSNSKDWVDGIGVTIKYIPQNRLDTLETYSNSPWREFNPQEADILKSFFEIQLIEDSITYKYLTNLDSEYFGKYIR